MDGAHKGDRLYPAYTLAELKAWVAAGNMDAAKAARVQGEIERREQGLSVAFKVPQLGRIA